MNGIGRLKLPMVFVLLGFGALAWGDQRRPPLDLILIRDGTKRFHVEATTLVPVPERVVWQTVRDYDHLSEFIPMVVYSRRTNYRGLPAIEQVGRVRFLIFHFEARTIMFETFEPPSGKLWLRGVDGDFSRFDSEWTVRSEGRNTRIEVRSEAVLKRWVPQWLARYELKKAVRRSILALIAEMERRAAATSSPEPPR